MKEYAILSSKGRYSSFSYGDHVIRFRTSAALKKYTEVKHWDKGYLVVTADYAQLGPTEEYIDVSAILSELHIENDFLDEIPEVRIEY